MEIEGVEKNWRQGLILLILVFDSICGFFEPIFGFLKEKFCQFSSKSKFWCFKAKLILLNEIILINAKSESAR